MFSLCLGKISKFPVFSLTGNFFDHFPCFPCAVGTLQITHLFFNFIFYTNYSYIHFDSCMFLKKKKYLFRALFLLFLHARAQLDEIVEDVRAKSVSGPQFDPRQIS